jgi:hypothetical protein
MNVKYKAQDGRRVEKASKNSGKMYQVDWSLTWDLENETTSYETTTNERRKYTILNMEKTESRTKTRSRNGLKDDYEEEKRCIYTTLMTLMAQDAKKGQ